MVDPICHYYGTTFAERRHTEILDHTTVRTEGTERKAEGSQG
jgi:hypothetical protein